MNTNQPQRQSVNDKNVVVTTYEIIIPADSSGRYSIPDIGSMSNFIMTEGMQTIL